MIIECNIADFIMAKVSKHIVKVPGAKPRNPFVVAALKRSAGAHVKPISGVRQEAQRDLEKQLRSPPVGDEVLADICSASPRRMRRPT